MYNVLLLGAGTQGLAFVKSIHNCGFRVIMLVEERGNYADYSRFVNKRYHYRGNSKEDYVKFVLEVMTLEKIDTVVATGDATAALLCEYKNTLPNRVHVKLPLFENFQKGYDKNKLMSLCREKGYPHPKTIDMSNIALDSNSLREFSYPGMLKPNCTTGGRGMVEVKSYNELLERYPDLHKKYGEYHLQQFVKAGGKQIKIQLYINDRKQLIAHSVQQKIRWYPNKGGSNTCAVSTENEQMVGICYQILKDIEWIGFADFDAIEDPDTGELLIMEINPRLPACIKGSMVAGINWPEIIVNDALGLPQKKYKYKTGVYLRHLGLDFLWFLHAKNRWKVKPCWLKFIAHNLYYQDASSWTDPLPFIMGTWHNIAKLFDSDFKKAKQGL